MNQFQFCFILLVLSMNLGYLMHLEKYGKDTRTMMIDRLDFIEENLFKCQRYEDSQKLNNILERNLARFGGNEKV